MSDGPRRQGVSRAGLGCILSALILAAPALGPATGNAAPGDVPAADQYVESVPGANGPRIPGAEKDDGKGDVERLPSEVADRLDSEGGSDAAQLERLATSPELGAPSAKQPPRSSTAQPAAVAAASSTGTGDGSLYWLLGAMLIVTGVMVGGSIGKRRNGKRDAS